MTKVLTVTWRPSTELGYIIVEYARGGATLNNSYPPARGGANLSFPAGITPTLVRLELEHQHWPMRHELAPNQLALTVRPHAITQTGPLGWWHHAMGITTNNSSRGSGIKVGVIDLGLPTVLPGVPNITRLDHPFDVPSPGPWAELHGGAVMQMLAARSPPCEFEGIAPGVEVYFGPAGATNSPSKLSPIAVAELIELMSLTHQCDIISVSAGELPVEAPELWGAVRHAFDAGTICIFAGGNEPGPIAWPASEPDIYAVGAYGPCGLAPPDSVDWDCETRQGLCRAGGFYVTRALAFGSELNAMAPGISIFSGEKGRLKVNTGSSFAAPAAAGLLADQLACNKAVYGGLNGKARAQFAEGTLTGLLRGPVFSHAGVAVQCLKA